MIHRNVVQGLMSKRDSYMHSSDSGSRASTRVSSSTSSTVTEPPTRHHQSLQPPKPPSSRSSTRPKASAGVRTLPSIADHSSSLHFHMEDSDGEQTHEETTKRLKPAPSHPLPRSNLPESRISQDSQPTSISEVSEDEGSQVFKFPTPPRSPNSLDRSGSVMSNVGSSICSRLETGYNKRSSIISTVPSFTSMAASVASTKATSPGLDRPFAASSPRSPSLFSQKLEPPAEPAHPDWPPFGTFADPNALAPSTYSFRSNSISTRTSSTKPSNKRQHKQERRRTQSARTKSTTKTKRQTSRRDSRSFLSISDEESASEDDEPQPLPSDFGMTPVFPSNHKNNLVRKDSVANTLMSAKRSDADVPEDASSILSGSAALSPPPANSLASEPFVHVTTYQPSLTSAIDDLPPPHPMEVMAIESQSSSSPNGLERSNGYKPRDDDLEHNPFHLSPEAYTKKERGQTFRKALGGMFNRPHHKEKTRPENVAVFDYSDETGSQVESASAFSAASSTRSNRSRSIATASSDRLSGDQISWRPQWGWRSPFVRSESCSISAYQGPFKSDATCSE